MCLNNIILNILVLGLVSNSRYFPPIEESHCEKLTIYREDIAVDINNLVKSLCPGINMDAYHVGFPSLNLIPITVGLNVYSIKFNCTLNIFYIIIESVGKA